VAYVTSQDGGISVIDLNSLEVAKQVFPPNVAPRGLGLTFNGEYLLTAQLHSEANSPG